MTGAEKHHGRHASLRFRTRVSVYLCGLLLLFTAQMKELRAQFSGDAVATPLGASACRERRPMWSRNCFKADDTEAALGLLMSHSLAKLVVAVSGRS